jgi:EmrB/QacA subfamily drug resistance transporter
MTKPWDNATDRATIPWPVFAVTVAGAFMVALDLSIVNVAFPSIERSFPSVSTATLSWVLSGYSVVFGALLLGAGRIADRSGRRRSFQRGLAVFTLGSAVCGLAPAPWLLIVGRVVQASGAALLMPASLALLLAATPATARATAVALWGGISALAVAAGPSLGSLLITAGGWRWVFFVNLPIAVVAGIAVRRVVTESSTGGAPPDLLGIGLISLAVASVALGITQGGSWGWTSARIVGSFVVAAVSGPLALRRARRHPVPAIDLRVFESRTVTIANAATLAYAVAFFAILLSYVLFLTTVWHYSTLRAGLAITPGPLLVATLSAPAGRLAGRFGYRPVLVTGGLVFVAGEIWLATRVNSSPDYLRNFLPPALLVAVGVAASFPVLSAAAVAGLPTDRFAAGGAINQTARQLGAVLGVALLVAILGAPATTAEAVTHFHHVWFMCAAFTLLSAAISMLHRPIVATAALAPEPAQFVTEVVAL